MNRPRIIHEYSNGRRDICAFAVYSWMAASGGAAGAHGRVRAAGGGAVPVPAGGEFWVNRPRMIHEYSNGRRGIRAFVVYSWMVAFAGGEFWRRCYMNITLVLIFLVIAVVGGFIIWRRVDSLRCVTCGRTHFMESEVYRCDQCGKSFCRDKVAYGEKNSVSSQGIFSSAFASSSSSISFSDDKCGVVSGVIINGKRKPNTYLCSQHAEM